MERPFRPAVTAAVVVFAVAHATAGEAAQATAGVAIAFLTRGHLRPPHLPQHQRRVPPFAYFKVATSPLSASISQEPNVATTHPPSSSSPGEV